MFPREIDLHLNFRDRLPRMYDCKRFAFGSSKSRSECCPLLDCSCELKYVMEETQTFVFICKPEESAKVNTKEKVGEKEHSGHEN